MNTIFKDNEGTIAALIKMLEKSSPMEDTYEFLQNELLIQVYTSYENFLKKILANLFKDAKKNYRYSPFLVDHKLWSVVENSTGYIVPNGKWEAITKNFPLIKYCYFQEGKDSIDELVGERNSFAHSGSHMLTFKNILKAYKEVNYLCEYIDFCYTELSPHLHDDFIKVQEFLLDIKRLYPTIMNNFRSTGIISETITVFDKALRKLEKLDSTNVFLSHPRVNEIVHGADLKFILHCNGQSLDDFSEHYSLYEGSLQNIFGKSVKINDMN